MRRGRLTNDGKDFSATQAGVFLEGFTFRGFVRECCAEHERRMGEFDPDLLQPRFLPRLAGIALTGLGLVSERAPRETSAREALSRACGNCRTER